MNLRDADDAWKGLSFPYPLAIHPFVAGNVELEIWAFANFERAINDYLDHAQANGHLDFVETYPPYFGQIWPSARGLTNYLALMLAAGELAIAAQPRILELGCGLAVPSLWLAKAGFLHLEASDCHPDVPIFFRNNCRLNQLVHPPRYVEASWAKRRDVGGQFDWIVGSDIVYERSFVDDVSATLVANLKPGGRMVIADPGRPHLQEFVCAMQARGFVVDLHAVGAEEHGEIFVLDMRRR
jgi:predicted nicotinamide N-methyase